MKKKLLYYKSLLDYFNYTDNNELYFRNLIIPFRQRYKCTSENQVIFLYMLIKF